MGEDSVGERTHSASASGGDLGPSHHGPGDALGRFEIVEQIGQGGMGRVFRARDPQLDRDVALKVLDRGSELTARVRIVREAQALARLSHPNVVPVFDVGEHEECLYIAMELVEGVDLKSWIEEHSPSFERTLELFAQAGAGLTAAHAEGIVHRDFKPSNAMVTHDGRVQVLDFGLALDGATGVARSESNGPDGTSVSQVSVHGTLTADGDVMGTPAYMAPEQHWGQAADERADQYAFAITLYEALYGVRPYRGSTFSELARAKEHPPRFDRPPRAGVEVPRWIRAPLRRAMATLRDDRFASLQTLLDALDPGPVRRRRIVGATVILLAGVAGGVAATQPAGEDAPPCESPDERLEGLWDEPTRAQVHESFRATEAPFAESTWTRTALAVDDYAHQWASARSEACIQARSGHAAEVNDRRIACLDSARAALTREIDELREADPRIMLGAVGRIAGLKSVPSCETPTDPAFDAPDGIRQQVEDIRAELTSLRNSIEAGNADVLVEVDALIERSEKLGFAPIQAEAHLSRSALLDMSGDYEGSLASAETAFRLASESSYTRYAFLSARQMAFASGFYLGRFDESERWVAEAQTWIHRSPSTEAPVAQAQLLGIRGAVYDRQGRSKEGRDMIAEGLEILRASPSTTWRDLGPQLANLANAEHALGEFDASEEHFTEALELYREHYGPDHPDTAMIVFSLGNAYRAARDQDRALEHYLEAKRILEGVFGTEHTMIAGCHNNIASIYSSRGQADKALVHLEQAIDIERSIHGDGGLMIPVIYHNAAEAMQAVGREREAIEYHERGLAVREEFLPPDSPEIAISLYSVASARMEAGELGPSIERNLDRAVEILDKTEGYTGDRCVALSERAELDRRRGKLDSALERAVKAVDIMKDPKGRDLGYAAALKVLWQVRTDRGEHADAVEVARLSLEEQKIRSNPCAIASAGHRLAQSLDAVGKKQEALSAAEAALRDVEGCEADDGETRRELAAWVHEHD